MASKKKVTITAEETFAPDRDITLANPVEGTTNVVTEEKVKIQESATSREIFGGESLDTSRLRVRFANTLGNVSARLRSVFEREKTTTDPGVKESIEKEKNKLLREKVRTIRLSEIQIKGEANEREILKKREKFEDLKTSDILYLRQKGADIASLLLVPTDNPLGVVDGGKIEKGQKFTVNFGENKSISRSLGAGDILPATVQKISVNGKVGIYANSPRPGYYTAWDKKPLYLPVYDGDTIEILEVGKLSEADIVNTKNASEKRFEQMRINDMIDAMNLRGDAWREEFTSLPEDEKLIEQAKVEKENRKNESSYLEKLYGKANGRENFLAYFGSDLNRITKSYGINPTWLLALIEKEGSGFNAFTKSTGSAVGLGQITDDTWTELTSKIIPADARAMELVGGSRLERYNPIHQMIAMCSYLEHIRVKKPTANWSDAAIYYHTGMNATDADVPKYLKWNPAIAREMKGEPTLANYVDAARRYYNLAGLEWAWSPVAESTKKFDAEWESFASYPAKRTVKEDGRTMTWCAETARLNGSTFGLSLPANDANRVPDSYGNTPFSTSFESLPAGINVADVVLSSNTTNGKLFGHRALAVRAKTDNAWYILDPYYGNEKPIPVANYLSMYSSKNGGGITHLYGHKGQGVMAGLLA